jgi:hypothetical protein
MARRLDHTSSWIRPLFRVSLHGTYLALIMQIRRSTSTLPRSPRLPNHSVPGDSLDEDPQSLMEWRHSRLRTRPKTRDAAVDTPLHRSEEKDAGHPHEFQIERYKYILQQLHSTNENVHKYLALYQSIATALLGAAVALFVGYRKWNLPVSVATSALKALLWLVTIAAAFAVLLLLAGVFSWIDYRREECELTEKLVYPGFRRPPSWKNSYRWYELYAVAFIAATTVAVWAFALLIAIPAMN